MKKSTSKHWDHVGQSYASEWLRGGRKYVSERELQFIRDILSKYLINMPHPTHAIDLGIGAGRILSVLEESRVVDKLSGVDFSQKMILYCKKKFGNSKKLEKLIYHDISKRFPFKNKTFDIVTSLRAIKYNKNWREIIKECHRILKNNGILIFDMPHLNSINRFSNDEVAMYKTTPVELKQILADHGFDILEIKGGPRLPGFVYDRIDGLTLDMVIAIEKILAWVFGETNFARFLYVACRKASI